MRPKHVPDDVIPSGDETNRLHRCGYTRYREMFNSRQLLGLELSARIIAKTPDERMRNALATNLSDLLRYQNMLCRYDTRALKSLDIFSVHGFPVGLIQCESNFFFRKTKRAERIEGFDQTPDFIIPSEFNPQVIIEAKITEDDGTARDKVTRIQHLGELSLAGRSEDNPKYEVIACIGGRGFGVRREDMKKVRHQFNNTVKYYN